MRKPVKKNSSKLEGSSIVEEKDIFSELAEKKGTSLFLGKYTMNEVAAVLRKRNFLRDAQKKKL